MDEEKRSDMDVKGALVRNVWGRESPVVVHGTESEYDFVLKADNAYN